MMQAYASVANTLTKVHSISKGREWFYKYWHWNLAFVFPLCVLWQAFVCQCVSTWRESAYEWVVQLKNSEKYEQTYMLEMILITFFYTFYTLILKIASNREKFYQHPTICNKIVNGAAAMTTKKPTDSYRYILI